MTGIKNIYLTQLEELYSFQVEPGLLVSLELLEVLAFLTNALNREVAVYLNRKGQVTNVAVGESDRVSLTEQNLRRGSGRLSKLRCIHTHPNGSGRLSAVDLAALHSMRFDCMVAIGIENGQIHDIWAGFIKPGEVEGETMILGPMGAKAAITYNYLAMAKAIEQELAKPKTVRENGTERALVVGVELKGMKGRGLSAEESLHELSLLAEAAGAVVVKEVMQSRAKIDNAFYIGRGLAQDLRLLAQTMRVDLIIFDTELSGTQLRNLEENLGLKIVDRTGLILDIFAQRARSREGKLQVELAQLEYMLPRLRGVGKEMSRLAGGIGTRGPGETKLEKDRRHIRRRIFELKQELEQVSKQRKVTKSARHSKLPLVALVGYTNAGKSTLRYKLLEEVSQLQVDWDGEDPGTNQLFATLDPTVRGIQLPHGQAVLLADTVGFIQKLPHQLVSAFKATLEEVIHADLLIHVVDASNVNYYEQMLAVEQVLHELGVLDKKILLVFNKLDLVDDPDEFIANSEYPAVRVSASQGMGLKELLQAITDLLGIKRQEVRLAIPHDQARLLALIYEEGNVQEVDYRPEHVYLRALVDKDLQARLMGYEV